VTLASLVWPYAHLSFDVLPTEALITAGTDMLLAATTQGRNWQYVLSGVFYGGALLFRIDASIDAVVAASWVWWTVWRKGASPVILATWVVGPAIALGITAWYNELRFGSIFNDGHLGDPNVVVAHNPLTGIALELISPEWGPMVVMPVALVALLGWRLLRQRNALLAWYVLEVPVLYATVEGRFFNWSGADAWGLD
jgi:hypothetical protein